MLGGVEEDGVEGEPKFVFECAIKCIESVRAEVCEGRVTMSNCIFKLAESFSFVFLVIQKSKMVEECVLGQEPPDSF